MVKEFRCITFNSHETITAYIRRKQRLKEELPYGSIIGMTFRDTDSGVVSLLRVSQDDGTRVDTEIGEAEMAAGLVEFCLNRKMPMPRQSRKTLEVNRSNDLSLMLYMDDCIPKKASRRKQ
jgi:hypothetical protein